MRPLKLSMQAFGPYTNLNTVDFSLFADSELFLITGTTGSGKTSIFDAISFALYGKPSGNVREVDMLRNISADSSTETFVDFEFKYHGQIYKIWRKPRYMRLKRSGDGLTESIADAELTLPSGEIISGVKSVNEKILEILKIDQQQFSQIVMIAQNDFLKFLTSDTASRKSILRTIFNTDFYADFEKELKVLSSIEKEKLSKEKVEYETHIKSLNSINLDEDQEAVYQHSVIMERLETLQRSYLKNINDLKKQQLNIKNDYSKIQERKTLAITHNKIIEDKTKYFNALETLNNNEVNIDNQRKTLQSLYVIQKDFISLDDEYQKVMRTSVDEKRHLEILEKELKQKEQDLRELEVKTKSMSIYEQEVITLKVSISDLEKERPKHLKLKELKTSYNNLKSEYSKVLKQILLKYKLLTDEVNDLQRQYEQEYLSYTKMKESYNLLLHKRDVLEKQFLESQAGLLASKLEADKPCPVCGSTNHPKPSRLADEDLELEYFKIKDQVSKDTIEVNLKLESLEVLKETLSHTKQEAQKHSEEILSETSQYEETLKELSSLEVGETEESLGTLNDKLKLLKQELLSQSILINKEEDDLRYHSINDVDMLLNKSVKQVQTKELFIKTLKDSEIKLNQEHIKLSAKYHQSERTYTKLKNEKEALEAKLTQKILKHFNNLEDYESLKSQVSNTSKLESTIKEYDQERIRLEGLYHDYTDQAKGLEITDIESLDFKLNELEKDQSICDEQLNELKMLKEHEKRIMKSLELLSKNIESLDKSYQDYQSLSQTASGSLSGKAKIQFETYAQMAYFERILHFANQRLKVMSNHQYELIRRDKATNKQSQGGLDIDIFDHYHGTQRDVGSLSGGELFNASLALALGLSDVIQHVSGGIQIDALFIDEGFGSLSDEYLENAIQTLLEVAGADRMIGVISHVKELKDAISKQILIEKDQAGSHIHIQNN